MTRHVKTEGGVKRYHEPVGSPIVGHPHAPKVTTARERMDQVQMEARSVATQERAQKKAENWYNDIQNAYDPPSRDAVAAQFWEDYQIPGKYGEINAVLRRQNPADSRKARIRSAMESVGLNPDDPENAGYFSYTEPGPSRAELLSTAKHMFDVAGTKTTQPITVYRALRADNTRNWSETFQPGSVFEDDGMVSTTAMSNYAEGWLSLDGTADGEEHKPEPGSTVVEIRVPTGTTIVGGVTQFIETMLPPGSRLRVVSKEQVTTRTAESPLDPGVKLPPFTYTHVVADYIGAQ